MKICPKCKTEHTKLGTHCSRSCANSRVFSDITNKKRSESNKKSAELQSPETKEKITAKRLASYRVNKPEVKCIDCDRSINRANKHNRCQECYFRSDLSSYSQGHYKNYKRLAVVDTVGNSVYLMSSMEIQYYEWLIANNISWRKPNTIKYLDNTGKHHWYKPDFYLIETNEIIEIKGHYWNNDRIKMQWVIEQHPNLTIRVLMKDDLKNLGGKSIRADTGL
jgi:hypothetical protein